MVLYRFGVSVVRESAQYNPDSEGKNMRFVGKDVLACHRGGYGGRHVSQ